MLQHWIDRTAGRNRRKVVWLSVAAVIFCLVEQINLLPTTALSRSREFAWSSAVPKPLLECEAFFVNIFGRKANFLDDNDAIWISWKTRLPTLNGTSGWTPPGWRLEDPQIEYMDAVREWIAASHLNQVVCGYDRETGQWFRL